MANEWWKMFTDREICDALGVPEEARPKLIMALHQWSMRDPVGPNLYVVRATLIWAMMRNADDTWQIVDDPFDPADWVLPASDWEKVTTNEEVAET